MNDSGFPDQRHGDARLLELFAEVADGRRGPREALSEWHEHLIQPSMATVRADLTRADRVGFPEVVYAASKSPMEVRIAMRRILDSAGRVLVTRAETSHAEAVRDFPEKPEFVAAAGVIVAGPRVQPTRGRVAVISAGTSDVRVAEEAAITAEMMGAQVDRQADIGVAGLHRLLERLPDLRRADVLIVVAGFEAALASVVGGLVSCPVIAVPTSIGYGASFRGVAALLSLLNSCAPGVTVVNIDNGFGAGFAAGRILASLDSTRSAAADHPPVQERNPKRD